MSDERKHENQVRVERLAGIGRSYELLDLEGDRVTVVTHRGRVDLIIRSSDGRGLEVVATLSGRASPVARPLALPRVRALCCRVPESMRHQCSDLRRASRPRRSRWSRGQATRPLPRRHPGPTGGALHLSPPGTAPTSDHRACSVVIPDRVRQARRPQPAKYEQLVPSRPYAMLPFHRIEHSGAPKEDL
jgi:hypothetical protein